MRLVWAIGLLSIATSGCAIDGAQLVTDVVQAALDSATTSIVDSLSDYLARH
jgi:hypothetical protein